MALQDQFHFLETLINMTPSPTFYKNVEGIYMGCNGAFEVFWGVSRDQIIGKTVYDLAPRKLADKYHEMDSALFRQPGAHVYETCVLGTDGIRHDVVVNKATFVDSTGNVAGLVGVILDITERKRVEEALRESERQLRALSSQLLTAQEEEKKRVARELHDSIGSSLTAIKISLENVIRDMETGKATSEPLRTLVSITQQAIEESRKIMTDLRPSILDDLGIVTTLHWFCRQFRTIYPNIDIELGIKAEESGIPDPLKIVIFRVVQEALNNIAKHSKAESVNLSLVKNGNAVQLTIKDDGVGFDPNKVSLDEPYSKGLGLTSMRERVELSGGTFSIQSLIKVGATIRALWPQAQSVDAGDSL